MDPRDKGRGWGRAWVIPKNTDVSPAGGIWEGKQAAQCDHS